MNPDTHAAVAAYLAERRRAPNALLERLEAEAHAEGFPIVSPATGDFLELLVRIGKPERILEIGTSIGYSAIRMARALATWGEIDTCEIDLDIASRAERNFAAAGFKDRIHVYRGPCVQLLPTIQNRYDFCFIDAKKAEYEAYLTLALKLMPKGGTVVCDNLLWGGRVAAGDQDGDPEWRREATREIRRFNEVFLSHPELKAQILPIGDGLGLAVKV